MQKYSSKYQQIMQNYACCLKPQGLKKKKITHSGKVHVNYQEVGA